MIEDWAMQHWILFSMLAWWALAFCWSLGCMVIKLANRVLRTVKVLCRGWPPEHLDADGDWQPREERS